MAFAPCHSIEPRLWDTLTDNMVQGPNVLRNNLPLNSPLELTKTTLVPYVLGSLKDAKWNCLKAHRTAEVYVNPSSHCGQHRFPKWGLDGTAQPAAPSGPGTESTEGLGAGAPQPQQSVWGLRPPPYGEECPSLRCFLLSSPTASSLEHESPSPIADYWADVIIDETVSVKPCDPAPGRNGWRDEQRECLLQVGRPEGLSILRRKLRQA